MILHGVDVLYASIICLWKNLNLLFSGQALDDGAHHLN